jgi:hypothetical protein
MVKNNLAESRYLKLFTLYLCAASIWGCSLVPKTSRAEQGLLIPRAASPKDLPEILRSLPSHIKFSYSGIAFLNGKLYAASNIGLLEYDSSSLSKIYKWYDKDDVVSGPWPDHGDRALWAFHNGLGKLVYFDGKTWGLRDLPQPKEGFTRGDFLRGFVGVSDDSDFWLKVGDNVWRWNHHGAWEKENVPGTAVLINFAPLKGRRLYVVRNDPFLNSDQGSDVILSREGDQWREVPRQEGLKLSTAGVAVSGGRAFLMTEEGTLFLITPSDINPIEAPGYCEAITTTTQGTLLASFRDKGIYEFTGSWHQEFPSPYTSDQGEHWAYLAESDGRVAFAISAKPQGLINKTYAGQTSLWLSNGPDLKQIKW